MIAFITNSLCTVTQKSVGPQLVKKFHKFKVKVHYSVHSSPGLVPMPFHFFKIHFIIILKIFLGFPSGLFPLGFPTKSLYAYVLSSVNARPSQLLSYGSDNVKERAVVKLRH
jgi:hypothetical protein